MAAKKVQRSNMTQIVDGKVTRAPKDDSLGKAKFFWWKRDIEKQKDQLAEEIAATIKFIGQHQSARIDQLTISTRLYGNNSAYNMLGAAFTRASAAQSSPSASRISFNLCASIIDTLTAQVAKNKVVPTFITSGGVWGMQRKAENLSKFIEGIFYEQNAHERITYQARDAGCWGDGIIHPYRDDNDRVAYERVLPHELLVDIVESMVSEKPKQIHRVKIVDRNVLAELFSDDEDALQAIMDASPASYQDIGGSGTAADLVVVAESWHLRSGEKAKDGLHVISLPDSGKTLLAEEYEKDYFPFVDLRYSKRLLGYWGQGACERLMNLQGEINRLMILVQKSMWMGGSFKILVENGSKVVSQHLNNEVGAIIHYTGTPPQYITPPMIQQDIYQYIDSLIAKGYQQEGISQLAASNVKPMGINSGTALRTYDTIAEDRQLFFGQRVENAALELARQSIELVKDIYKEKGKYEVKYPNTNFLETIDWKDIDLKMDEYWLKAFPTSELPEEPAAKLETVTEYMQAGLISPRAGRRLLSMPDVEMADKLANAAEELICKTIEDIIYDKKESATPDPEWDLQLAQNMCLQYLNYAKLNNCPKKNIQLLREFKTQIDQMLGLLTPPQPPPDAPAPGGQVVPMANPTPTPVSPMVPNVNGGQAA